MPAEINLSRASALLNMFPDTSSRDWYSIRQEMLDAIPILNPEYTARNLSDPGITIIELLAFAMCGMHYSQDQIHRDSRFKESFSRDAILSFAELISYEPRSYAASTVDVTYTLDVAQDVPTTIPAAAEMQTTTEPTVYFENDSALTIAGPVFADTTTLVGTTTTIRVADSSDYDIGAKIEVGQDLVLRIITDVPNSTTVAFSNHPLAAASQSAAKVRYYLSSVTEVPVSITGSATEGRTQTQSGVGTGDGTKLQEFEIGLFPIVQSTLRVYINEGAGNILWNKSTNNRLINHDSNENVYEVSVNGNDRVVVRFGDGTSGRRLPIGATLTVTARVGGGTRGNVIAGSVSQLNTTVSVTGTLVVTNVSSAAGGQERETIESIKKNAPNNLSSIAGNLVSIDDFKTAAEAVAGVEKAQAILQGFNKVNVYIVPSGPSGSSPSAALLSLVESSLNANARRLITVRAIALPPNYVTIDVEGTIYLEDNVSRATSRLLIEDAIETYFAATSRSFGQNKNSSTNLHLSDLYHLIEEINGVQYSEINKYTRRPKLEQLRWSGNATISTISIGESVIDDTFEILFLSPTSFRVISLNDQSALADDAVRSNTGVLGVPFTMDDFEIGFTLSAGATPMSPGDSGRIITGKYLSNSIIMYDREFPVQGYSIGVTGQADTIQIVGGYY